MNAIEEEEDSNFEKTDLNQPCSIIDRRDIEKYA
jgi:hypothetical protein